MSRSMAQQTVAMLKDPEGAKKATADESDAAKEREKNPLSRRMLPRSVTKRWSRQ